MGEFLPERKSGSGRPRSGSEKQTQKILKIVEKERSFSLRALEKDTKINAEGLSRYKIGRILDEDGLKTVRKQKKFQLSEEHMANRVNFAKRTLRKGV